MATGWIRAYAEENQAVNSKVPYFRREARAAFRAAFSTPLRDAASATGTALAQLGRGDVVELPDGIGDGDVIMCATLDETEDDWIVHRFAARFSG